MTTGSDALSRLFRDLRAAAPAETGVRVELTETRLLFQRDPDRRSAEGAAHPAEAVDLRAPRGPEVSTARARAEARRQQAGQLFRWAEWLTDPGICPTGTVA